MRFLFLNIFLIVSVTFFCFRISNADTATEAFDKGVAAFNKGDYEAALLEFNRALKLNMNTVLKAEAYANIGRIYNLQGKRKEAIESCNKALGFDSGNVKAYICNGNANIALGNQVEALSNFKTILKYDPSNINAYVGMGTAKKGLGDYSGAIRDYDTAIALGANDPTNGEIMKAYLGRGISKFKLGQTSEGCEDLRMAGKLGLYKAYQFAEQICH